MSSRWISAVASAYILRILLCLLPQTGYLQPDEFFQFTEPVASWVLHVKTYIPWEFTVEEPVRSVFLPNLICGPCFYVLKWYNQLTPYALLVLPRVVFTLVSFSSDYSLFVLCRITHVSPVKPLFVFGTSYITFCYFTHTFTNAIEALLLSQLLVRISADIVYKKSDNALALGVLMAIGIFNRPTFVCFALVPGLFWIFTREATQLHHRLFWLLKPTFALTVMSAVLVAIDTFYYRGISVADAILDPKYLWSEKLLRSLVVTPYNFLKYNTRQSNLEKHGLHPYYQHALVNVPILFSVLALYAYRNLSTLPTWSWQVRRLKQRPRNCMIVHRMMALSFLVSLLLLSIIPHQEPRFLIPLLMPMCYLYAAVLCNNRVAVGFWIITNCVAVAIYGFVHQAGVVNALFEMHNLVKIHENQQLDLIFARTYLPPQHLLAIDANTANLRFHDLSIQEFPEKLFVKLKELKDSNIKSDVYVAIPSSLELQMKTTLNTLNINNFNVYKHFFPHFTAEDLMSSLEMLFTKTKWSLKDAFGFHIWKVTL